jgi:phosphoribosylformimino-5-aminoimidazole carboxamide ribotide isomerase
MTSRKHDERPFDLLPAIDLRGGHVVRLLRGDFEHETVYADDPVAVAGRFVEEGARWLHVVDLDGARDPAARQLDLVAAIVAGVGERARVEVAGGLRTDAAVDEMLRAGAARAVVGTAALEDAALAARLVAAHGADRVAVALDVRDGLAVGHGWRPGASGVPVEEALTRLAAAGVTTFEVTTIDRDGTLGGPDLDLLARLVAQGMGAIIASAGIATLGDLRVVRGLGCAGAIVGRALYEGRLSLPEAIAEAAGSGESETGRT